MDQHHAKKTESNQVAHGASKPRSKKLVIAKAVAAEQKAGYKSKCANALCAEEVK